MASLHSFLNPDAERLRAEQEQTRQVEQTVPEGPNMFDVAQSAYSSSYMHTLGVGTIAVATDYLLNGHDATTYTEEQLAQIYPEVPPEVFKGGARAYQAEFLADKYRRDIEAKQIQEFVQGVSDPNASILSTVSREAVPFASSLVGGLADIANIPIAIAGGAVLNGVSKAAIPLMSKISPSAYKYMIETIKSSRFVSNIVPEVVSNLATDVAITYPAQNYLLSGYTKDETTLSETVKQSLGSALLFGVGRSIFKGKNLDFGNYSSSIIQEGIDRAIVNNADLGAFRANSDAFGEAILKTAVADAVINPSKPTQSIRAILAEKAFKNASNDIPDQGWFALSERASGSTEYIGDRFGDNLVFIDSPGAVDGMAKTLTIDSPRSYDIYSINPDNYKLLDLENTKLNDYPGVMDLIEERFGSSALQALPENATLRDAFDKINKARITEDNTAEDVIDLFNRIHKIIGESGYDGIVHTNQYGDAHKVMEIFPDRVNPDDLQKTGEIQASSTETPVDNIPDPRNQDVVLEDGTVIKATDELPHDPFYDDDFEFTSAYNKKLEIDPKKDILEVDPAEFESIADELVTEDVPALKKELDAEKAVAKKETPEYNYEVAKAMEDCLRKNK